MGTICKYFLQKNFSEGLAFYVNNPYYITEVEPSGVKKMKMEQKER